MAEGRLPLFPLPVVLLPGTPMPLHIFELRYRRLVADLLASDGEFGIAWLPAGTAPTALPRGWAACTARLMAHEPLEDGRSNIVVQGGRRVALVRLVEDPAPYHVAQVAPALDTAADEAALADAATALRATFVRVGTAARALADDPAPLPSLSADPCQLAYDVASLTEVGHDAQHRLLGMRDPLARLAMMSAALSDALPDLERRAAAHRRAATNGHGPH